MDNNNSGFLKLSLVAIQFIIMVLIGVMPVQEIKAQGFKKGTMQHCINTKWQDFNDRQYYTYVKTLNSGMKLYRFEVYVLNGLIKVQSSNFRLLDQTSQTLKEMDAWIMSCNPISTSGNINSSKSYILKDVDVLLANKEIGIHFMVSERENANTDKGLPQAKESLTKNYANQYFSIKYPNSWQIVQDENKITNNTTISVQIMEKEKNDYDFSPNINIIVSNKKWFESTSSLADITIANTKKLIPSYQFISKEDGITLSNCRGTKTIQTSKVDGYKIKSIQYIVKKKDHTTYIITITLDNAKFAEQIGIANLILNSLILK